MPSFSAAYGGHTIRHCTRASRELVDVRPREQIICNTRFERKNQIVVVVNSNSQYFAIFNQLAKKQYRRAKALSTAGNCYNSSSWSGLRVKIGWKERDRAAKESKK